MKNPWLGSPKPTEIVKSVRIQKPYPWQKDILNLLESGQKRHAWIVASRQIGKTKLAQILTIKTLLHGGSCLWIAPTYAQVIENYRAIAEMVDEVTIYKSTGKEIITHSDGAEPGHVWFRSADNPDSLRGLTLDLACLDEAAWADPQTLKAVRPMLSKREGRLFLISSPNGHNFWFHHFEKCQKAKDWYTCQLPWHVAPHLKPEEIEATKAEMLPSEFRQEYLASFESPTGAVFDSEWLDPKKLFVTQDQMPKPNERQRSMVAVDLALGQLKGKRLGDLQAVCALLVKDNICYADMWAGRVPIPALAQKVKDMVDFWQCEGSAWEENGFQSLAQSDFLKLHEVPPYVIGIQNQIDKPTRIARLATLLKRGHLRILDNEGGRLLHQQLQDFPMGKHSFDTLDALEMCWRTLTNHIRR